MLHMTLDVLWTCTKWYNKNGFKFYSTSAKEGTNVNDAFETIAQLGYEFIKMMGKRIEKMEKLF